jgi:hypothetical protein
MNSPKRELQNSREKWVQDCHKIYGRTEENDHLQIVCPSSSPPISDQNVPKGFLKKIHLQEVGAVQLIVEQKPAVDLDVGVGHDVFLGRTRWRYDTSSAPAWERFSPTDASTTM